MDFQKAKSVVIGTLKKDLNPLLHYHNHRHTLDVLDAVERLCAIEEIGQPDLDIVRTAALFHDTGFLFEYDDNEKLACTYAHKVLPDLGYSNSRIMLICEAILATRIPQNPAGNKLSMILCDADLDYLGRDDFFTIALNLHQEWQAFHNKTIDFLEWYNTQFEFLVDHRYFTNAARNLREKKKHENLSQIKKLLSIVDEVGNADIASGMLHKKP